MPRRSGSIAYVRLPSDVRRCERVERQPKRRARRHRAPTPVRGVVARLGRASYDEACGVASLTTRRAWRSERARGWRLRRALDTDRLGEWWMNSRLAAVAEERWRVLLWRNRCVRRGHAVHAPRQPSSRGMTRFGRRSADRRPRLAPMARRAADDAVIGSVVSNARANVGAVGNGISRRATRLHSTGLPHRCRVADHRRRLDRSARCASGRLAPCDVAGSLPT